MTPDADSRSRLRRPAVLLSLVPALALGGLVVWALLPPPASEPESVPEPGAVVPPAPVHEAAPPGPKADERLAERFVDPAQPLEDRVSSLKALAMTSKDVGPVLAALSRLEPEDPQLVQLRALGINAMQRFPDDPAARAFLASCLEPARPRSERLAAIDVMARNPDRAWSRSWLESLGADADPAVREKAGSALDRLGD